MRKIIFCNDYCPYCYLNCPDYMELYRVNHTPDSKYFVNDVVIEVKDWKESGKKSP